MKIESGRQKKMRDDWKTEQLRRKVERGEVEWFEHPGGGFAAQIKGIALHIVGSETSFIELRLQKGFNKKDVISEPQLPLWKKNTRENSVRNDLREILRLAAQQCIKRAESGDWQERVKNELWEEIIGKI